MMATQILKIVQLKEGALDSVTIGSKIRFPSDILNVGGKVVEVVDVQIQDCPVCRQQLGTTCVFGSGYYLVECRDCGTVFYRIR